MKKVLLTGAALMLMGGMIAPVVPAVQAAEPGVQIDGDARVRIWYMDDNYKNSFGNTSNYDSQINSDSRVRVNITGTAAGGSYAKVRLRIYDSLMGSNNTDSPSAADAGSVWVDKAYLGVPFNDAFTLEMGKYRLTYGPNAGNNFFYNDLPLGGLHGIVKLGNVEINPGIEWIENSQNSEYKNTTDFYQNNNEIRYSVHIKAKVNNDWTVGALVGYQSDDRTESKYFTDNDGFFGSIYAKGKSGNFAIDGTFAVTDKNLNGMNALFNDTNVSATSTTDLIGSNNTGFGGYVFPNFQIDKLNLGLNIGFTTGGFVADSAFGFVMMGSGENWKVSNYQIGTGGDWTWIGFVPSYQIDESLKLTGNLVYANINPWDDPADGPQGAWAGTNNKYAADSVWELSGSLAYTISKGMTVTFMAGYLKPNLDNPAYKDDGEFAAMTEFDLKF